MKSENLIIIALYLTSFLIVYTVAIPLYSGAGSLKAFPDSSNVMYELARHKDLESLYDEAVKLKDNGLKESVSYKNIDQAKKLRIDLALPKKIDMARVINDLDKIAHSHNMNNTSISFSKIPSSSAYSGVNIYLLNLALEGTYLNFKEYMDAVQNSLQLYNVKSLSFSKSDSQTVAGAYNFSVSLETFELK